MEERHYLIGTAGHVDHGKTELIRALTGIETDRLKEEKQRGISIELGFAHMVLPSGRQVGIVDVPGHERFVRQMLAGASGMDIVLLVIAADEGVMPQTKEHLNILTLLGISNGIVVLSKIDLVDSEWKELIEEEIREDLKDTIFAESPIYPVSALTGEGIPELKHVLDNLLKNVESKKSDGPVRIPVDRVFSMQGFGTIVTGTLHSGTLESGQEIKIEPQNLLTKVRSLHVHGKKQEKAYAGQRIAANLTGVNVEEVQRGAVLVTPNVYRVGNIIDLKIKYLEDEKPLVQRQRVRFHMGTAEVLGRIHLLDHEEMTSGQEGFAQIILEEPVVAAPGDHFVLRFYSPAHTIAGGKILGVADFKLKRFKESALALMTLKDKGNPEELLERELENPLTLNELETSFHMPAEELKKWLQQLLSQERLDVWNDEGVEFFWAKKSSDRWQSRLVGTVKAYQKSYPLRGGIGREELKSKLGIDWSHRRWQQILEIGAKRSYYKLMGNKVGTIEGTELPEGISRKLNCLRKNWENTKLMPPDLETKALECGISKNEAIEYALYLVDHDEWVQVANFFFGKKEFEEGKQNINDFLKTQGEISVGEARELWQTSRKYTVPLLEYFDEIKVTRRQGDKRILGSSGQ